MTLGNKALVDNVALCGHILGVKKRTSKTAPLSVNSLKVEAAAAGLEARLVVNVRTAKDQLSRLLEQAAEGNEVIITSDGRPKARLVPVNSPRRRFAVDWDLLRSMPVQGNAPAAEEFIRADRDARP